MRFKSALFPQNYENITSENLRAYVRVIFGEVVVCAGCGGGFSHVTSQILMGEIVQYNLRGRGAGGRTPTVECVCKSRSS